jgi:hypothetical protein
MIQVEQLTGKSTVAKERLEGMVASMAKRARTATG